jgi:hypothetical protein
MESNTTLSVSGIAVSGWGTTTGSSNGFTEIGTSWNIPTLSCTKIFAQELEKNPLLKEGFKSMFSSFFREEFVKETESGKEITNEDLRRIADQAAEKFTDYLCKL